MAIQTGSEFEAVVNKVMMRAQRVLSERGSVAAVEGALRDLQRIFDAARKPTQLKALRATLETVTEQLTTEIPDDGGMCELLWDLADFIDYRA